MGLTMGSAAATLNDVGNLGHIAPAPLMIGGALFTMPFWLDTLRELSAFAADAAPIVGCVVGLVTLYKTLSGPKRDGERGKFFSRVGDAASDIVKKPGARSGLLLLVLGAVALAGHLMPGRKPDATPLALLAAQPVPRRTKAKDDAGEDGEAEAAPVVDGVRSRFVDTATGLRIMGSARSSPRVG